MLGVIARFERPPSRRRVRVCAAGCCSGSRPEAVGAQRSVLSSPGLTGSRPDDPLPSWNDGAAKQAILSFVARVTREDGPDFVPSAERIAVFDNDGTLWAEQPTYSRSSSRSTA